MGTQDLAKAHFPAYASADGGSDQPSGALGSTNRLWTSPGSFPECLRPFYRFVVIFDNVIIHSRKNDNHIILYIILLIYTIYIYTHTGVLFATCRNLHLSHEMLFDMLLKASFQ